MYSIRRCNQTQKIRNDQNYIKRCCKEKHNKRTKLCIDAKSRRKILQNKTRHGNFTKQYLNLLSSIYLEVIQQAVISFVRVNGSCVAATVPGNFSPNTDWFISLLPMNRIPHFRSTVGPQSSVPPRGPLHLHSAGVTFQHLPDPIIIQCSLYELLQTDDGCRHNKDRRGLRTKSRGQTLSISFGS